VAILNAVDGYVGNIRESIGVLGCWAVAGFTFAIGIVVKIVFPKWRMNFLSLLPVLIALITGYILSLIIGIVDFSPITAAAWIGFPKFSLPKFSWVAISFTVPIAIVTIVEHFGDILAIGNVVGKDFLADPKISRTLLGDGLATSLSALIGGPANTTYSENTGAVALTGVYNPAVMRIAAVTAIILSLIPKFTSVVATIPSPVVGGISILLFGMISAIGVNNMVDNRVNMGDPKVLMIVAAMMVLGLGTGSISSLQGAEAPGAAVSFGSFSFSGLGLAAIVGILLNLLINWQSFKKS
jgi:uracil permease